MGYIPFGASPRLCSKPLTGVQCLEVLSCGLRPVFTRNRLLVYNVLKCYLAVFAPPLPVTSTVVHCPGMSSKRAKGTIFAKSASFANASYKGKTHARKCKAAKTNNTGWFYKGFACSKDGLKAQQAYSPEQRSGYS